MSRNHPLNPSHSLFHQLALCGVTVIVFAVTILTLCF